MGAADCIVTGDQDLLELTAFRGLPILTPANLPGIATRFGPIILLIGVEFSRKTRNVTAFEVVDEGPGPRRGSAHRRSYRSKLRPVSRVGPDHGERGWGAFVRQPPSGGGGGGGSASGSLLSLSCQSFHSRSRSRIPSSRPTSLPSRRP